MNIFAELIDVYDKNEDLAGIVDGDDVNKTLLPISHSTMKAQVTVIIDAHGNFVGAEKVNKADKNTCTITPTTIKSGGGRHGSAIAPHMLCDQLKYVAGDLYKYSNNLSHQKAYEKYIDQLKDWKESKFSHSKVDAIYAYLVKETLIADLEKAKILTKDKDGVLKINEKDGVRFRVLSEYIEDTDCCWKDRDLFDCYTRYYYDYLENVRGIKNLQQPVDLEWIKEKQRGISYLSGKEGIVNLAYVNKGKLIIEPILHSEKIRGEFDAKPKLITANDDRGFVYRGRFADSEEAMAITYEDSQKMHNALKWLNRNFAHLTSDKTCIVNWVSALGSDNDAKFDADLPQIFEDSDRLMRKYEATDCEDNDYDKGEETEREEAISFTRKFSEDFRKTIEGYRQKFTQYKGVRVISLSLDAPGKDPGRLSIIGFNEFAAREFIDNLAFWHESCDWIYARYKDKERIEFRGMLGIRSIANLLYGNESAKGMALSDHSKQIETRMVRDLMPCIIQRAPLPRYLAETAVERASAPQNYEKGYNWEQTLSLACSLVKKLHYKEEFEVSLDKECKDRSYLYGRLLAVADLAESRAYDSGEKGRITNAKRYMSAFAARPFSTWQVVRQNLGVYLAKLREMARYYEGLIDEITDMFVTEDFRNDKKLDGLYLLGYSSQRIEMYGKNKNNEYSENETENTEEN